MGAELMPYVKAGHSQRRVRKKLIIASAIAAAGLMVGGSVLALLPQGWSDVAIASVFD